MYPKRSEIHIPLLYEIARRGGNTRPSDTDESGKSVYEALADHFDLSRDARLRLLTNRASPSLKWANIVQWTRRDLKDAGLLASPRHGVWQITPAGMAALSEAEVDITVSVGGPKHGIDLSTFLERKREAERIGRLGEEHVLSLERNRLMVADRHDLAGKVEHIALTDVGAGYDILSFEIDGSPRHIEVKTTRSNRISFEITANEVETATELGETYWLYRVSRIESESPLVDCYSNVASMIESGELGLRPVAYRAAWNQGEEKELD